MVYANSTNYMIKKFLRLNGNCNFQQIREHLEKNGKHYAQRQGLIKKLNALAIADEITKNTESKPPTYSLTKDQYLDSAILGERFREEFTGYTMGIRVGIDENYWRNDVHYDLQDNFETKFVKTMITRYGFYLLSVFVKGLEQEITNEKFDKKTWMSYTLDLVKDEEMYSSWFKSILTSNKFIETHTKKGKKQLKKLLDNVMSSMETLYPKLYQDINYYKFVLEKDPEVITSLKKNKEYRKKLSKK